MCGVMGSTPRAASLRAIKFEDMFITHTHTHHTHTHTHTHAAVCPHQPISWCKCEAVIQTMDLVTVATEQPPPPPLVVMSLSVKITLNPKTGTNEVCVGVWVRGCVLVCLAQIVIYILLA